MKQLKHHETLSLIFSALFLWLWMREAAQLPYNESGIIFGLNYNITVYLTGALLTFVIYLILSGIFGIMARYLNLNEPRGFVLFLLNIVYLIVFVTVLYYMYKIYRNETIVYPGEITATYLRQMLPRKPYFMAIFCLALALIRGIKRDMDQRTRNLMMIGFAILNGILLFAPNLTADQGGGTQHIDAYTTAITNVLHFVPFSSTNLSIYGHYPLFYLPLVKLMGDSYIAIAGAIAIFGAITYYALFRVASHHIRSDWTLFMTIAGITGTTTIFNRRGMYYQINPHRILFAALTILFVSYVHRREKPLNQYLRLLMELAIGSLAILWNLETGIFSVAILFGVRIYDALKEQSLLSLRILKELLIGAALFVLSFTAAFGITGIYNLLTGGAFGTVKDFIYPIASDTYQVNNLTLPLPDVTALYVLELILFVLVAVYLLISVIRKQETTTVDTVLFAIALSGCASILYFMNRTAFGNMSIQHCQFALLIGILTNRLFDDDRISIRDTVRNTAMWGKTVRLIILYVSLTWLSVESLVTLPASMSYRAPAVWNVDLFLQLTEEIDRVVPEDTLAYGIGMPQIYQQLGRDTYCHTIDTLDMNETNAVYRNSLIEQVDAVLTSEDFDEEIWDVQAQWVMPTGFVISYLTRK